VAGRFEEISLGLLTMPFTKDIGFPFMGSFSKKIHEKSPMESYYELIQH
jgi:hypothetical protein